MKPIRIEDLKPGMKVRIIHKRQKHWNSEGEMDKWMGKVMTIETIRHVDDITMQEDTGEGYRVDDHWTWHLSDIAEIIPTKIEELRKELGE